jgi:Ca2+-binding RTX toxin-like protein
MLKLDLTATPETLLGTNDLELVDFAATEAAAETTENVEKSDESGDFDAEWLKSANVIRADKDSGGVEGSDKNDLIVLDDDKADAKVIANAGDDRIHTGSGNDYIDAGSGNDTIHSGAGNDQILAGEGNDKAWASTGNDTLEGGEGDDFLGGDEGDDNVLGGNGSDTLVGWAGDDYLDGGEGDDTLIGDAGFKDKMFGGDGNDRLFDNDGVIGAHGGAGDDVIAVTFAADSTTRSDGKISGGAGNDAIFVDMNNAKFFLNMRADDIDAAKTDGNDYVELRGVYANSVVSMGGGDDYFVGGAGGDNVNGGAGSDWLAGGAGNDLLNGGEGWDRFLFAQGAGRDTIGDFQVGTDMIDLSGYLGAKGEAMNFEALAIAQNGANTVITLGTSDSITLNNVSAKLLSGGDFFFG